MGRPPALVGSQKDILSGCQKDLLANPRKDILSGQKDTSLIGPRQYCVIHKLGFGANSTVWLTQKTDDVEVLIAINVNTASATMSGPKANDIDLEAAMLEAAHAGIKGPSPHILDLLDHFTIHGPNGTYHVLVTNVVIPIVTLWIA